MPEDQTRLGMLNDRACGEVLKDEVVQRGRVGGRNVQEVISPSSDVKHLYHPGKMRGNGDEGLDLFAVMGLHADGNDGLDGQTDKGQVDVGVIPADDPVFAEGTNP